MAALFVLATDRADLLWLVPSHSHAFGKRSAPFEARAEMCRLAAAALGPQVSVCTAERLLEPPTFTLRLLCHLRDAYPGRRFRWVMGADTLRDQPAWRRFDLVERLAPPIVLGRGGGGPGRIARVHSDVGTVGLELPAVSSSAVRAALARGEDVFGIAGEEVSLFLGEESLESGGGFEHHCG